MSVPDPNQTLPPNPANVLAPGPGPAVGASFGRYRIDRELGRGGMGAVYLAHDTALDRPVALKVPQFAGDREVAAARFLREAQAAAGLQHPHICPVYDVGQIDGTHYLAMGFVRGETLAARAARQPFPPPEAARLVRAVALAMQYAHDRGVIHRDLKPVNVMLDEGGEPVVMDFGLARRRDATGPQLTVQGELMGTPAYMPPEQASGDWGRVGPAADVYSLGAVLYELLTGQPPFTGDLFALLSQIALDQPLAPSARRPELNPRFDAVVLKALAKNPADRWESMRALADALAGLTGTGFADTHLADNLSLTLRVVGTAFAYRPPPGLKTLTVGRQKRKPGDPPDQGNDFVLRVAGNDALSARISRRHFEVHRTGDGYALIDRSKGGVTRNGEPVPKETPVPLADGDLLGVAGVVTLAVAILETGTGPAFRPTAVVEVPAPPGAGGGRVQIEASVGEMVTADN